MSIIRTIHGELRWIIAIVAIIVLVKFLLGGWVSGSINPLTARYCWSTRPSWISILCWD